jgi:hypothetical protein
MGYHFGEYKMPVKKKKSTVHRWTAVELRKLPQKQRNAILRRAAILAEGEYRNNPELIAFEAFGKDDLHGESASTETR